MEPTKETMESKEKSVLIVSENNQGFLAKSSEEALKKCEVKTYNVSADDEDILKYLDIVSMILIKGGDKWAIHQAVLKQIKEKAIDNDIKITVYGNAEEIGEIKTIIPMNLIVGEYLRPINFSKMAEKIKKLVGAGDSIDRKKILVVDDSGMFLRAMMNLLEDHYDVALANSATTAISAISKKKPDLILLDYEMPICSGAQFLEMIRSENETSDIPVIFLTSRGDKETVNEVLALKPEGYILKSTSSDVILNKLEAFFSGK